MIKYGLISGTDARTIEKTIDLICDEFKNYCICVTEIGLYNCATANGICDYLSLKGINWEFTGVDNEKDKEVKPAMWIRYIKGNSTEVYNQIIDNSQHLIFIDGDHSYIGVISDFFAYRDKVKAGGYLVFHDTGKHINPFKDFQHGDENNQRAYISTRDALHEIGLLDDNFRSGWQTDSEWKLIFDEADETNEAGGICVFRKRKDINSEYYETIMSIQ